MTTKFLAFSKAILLTVSALSFIACVDSSSPKKKNSGAENPCTMDSASVAELFNGDGNEAYPKVSSAALTMSHIKDLREETRCVNNVPVVKIPLPEKIASDIEAIRYTISLPREANSETYTSKIMDLNSYLNHDILELTKDKYHNKWVKVCLYGTVEIAHSDEKPANDIPKSCMERYNSAKGFASIKDTAQRKTCRMFQNVAN